MINNNDIYWERQRGDNCRIHSINAFFGKEMVTEQEFYKYNYRTHYELY